MYSKYVVKSKIIKPLSKCFSQILRNENPKYFLSTAPIRSKMLLEKCDTCRLKQDEKNT